MDTSNINSLQDLVDSINNSSETAISASIVTGGGGSDVLRVIHNQGETLDFTFADGNGNGDSNGSNGNGTNGNGSNGNGSGE